MENTPHDREMLLREMHHRVKNNLQMVSSLLNLQSEHAANKTPAQLIEASQNRITSMSLLHDKICSSNDFYNMNIQVYVESVAQHLVRANKRSGRNLRCQLAGQTFSIDVLLPLGLIVNEIVTNSLIHGNAEDYESMIEISGERLSDNYHLSIRDNGCGFSFDKVINEDSLGLKLVKGLANQIKAKLNFSNVNGSNFDLLIPIGK